MVDDARNSMKADFKPGFRVLTGTNVMSIMKRDASAFQMLNAAQNFMDGVQTSSCNEEDSVRNLNYQLLLIFHADSERRPCRPVIQIISLPTAPNTILNSSTSTPEGNEIKVSCQLGDSSVTTAHHLDVDSDKILCVYMLSLTDTEAGKMITKTSKFNTLFSQNNMVLTERSNFVLVPVIFQKNFPVGARRISDMWNASSATDVQVAVILMMEGLEKSRSITARIERLHPYLATCENLMEAISIFMRKIEISNFNLGIMKFCKM